MKTVFSQIRRGVFADSLTVPRRCVQGPHVRMQTLQSRGRVAYGPSGRRRYTSNTLRFREHSEQVKSTWTSTGWSFTVPNETELVIYTRRLEQSLQSDYVGICFGFLYDKQYMVSLLTWVPLFQDHLFTVYINLPVKIRLLRILLPMSF